jgi:hypothetical protein
MEPLVLIVLSCSQVRDLIKTVDEADHLSYRERTELIEKIGSHCEEETLWSRPQDLSLIPGYGPHQIPYGPHLGSDRIELTLCSTQQSTHRYGPSASRHTSRIHCRGIF